MRLARCCSATAPVLRRSLFASGTRARRISAAISNAALGPRQHVTPGAARRRSARYWRSRCIAMEKSPHSEADAESGLDRSGHTEAAGQIEPFCVRIANDVQKGGRAHTSHVGNVIDETPSDALLPEVRL